MSGSLFVITKKPFMYKLGAKLFKWLILSNKVCEMERYAEVVEKDKITKKDAIDSYSYIWENKED